jgi:3-hydroxyacyl-CoA dehydrogenase
LAQKVQKFQKKACIFSTNTSSFRYT